MADVDVLIPCYRYARYLSGCVESVLSQGGVTVRAIILDDASPDETPAVGRALASKDPRVVYIRNGRNLGHIATYNLGIDQVTAPYMVLLSADDLLSPGALARAVDLLDRHPEAAMAYGKCVKWYSDELPDVAAQDPWDGSHAVIPSRSFLRRLCRTAENFVPTPTVVVRSSVQKRLGGYRPELPHAGDLEMWLRFGSSGSVIELNSRQAFYRFHAANMHRPYTSRMARDLNQRREAFDLFFRDFLNRDPEIVALRRSASHALALDALQWAGDAIEHRIPDDPGELVAFARSVNPRSWSMRAWWVVQAKRSLGISGIKLIRSLRRLLADCRRRVSVLTGPARSLPRSRPAVPRCT